MPSTGGSGWFTTLCALLDRAPHAVIVVDMSVPMLPIAYANRGFATLTGWRVDEAVGRNCRFLQGAQTEGGALSTLVSAVRDRTACRVSITNVRKDGSPFVNELSMHPVHDSKGVHRFMIGMQCDDRAPMSSKAMLAAIRHLLPTKFPASLNVREVPRVIVGQAPQESQFLWAMTLSRRSSTTASQ